MVVRIVQGDALAVLRTLPAESVQACITSPPYAFLRSYLPADHPDKGKEIGSEPTPEAFVAALVDVFRGVRRVLRRDGICVVNLGDSYAGSGKGPTGHNGIGDQEQRQGFTGVSAKSTLRRDGRAHTGPYDGEKAAQPILGSAGKVPGLPPKSLLMIPFRVAMAMQADGWILRSVMPWVKRNSMPESVTDRPASAIEYLFLFAKSGRYYWDPDAIRVPQSENNHGLRAARERGYRDPGHRPKQASHGSGIKANGSFHAATPDVLLPHGRSYRNSDPFFATWQGLMLDEAGDPLALVVNPQPSSLQHFASYPPSLVEPFVKAGSSQRGACPSCGAGWVRSTDVSYTPHGTSAKAQVKTTFGDRTGGDFDKGSIRPQELPYGRASKNVTTTGWRPGCACVDAGEPVPQTVLDPFLGSGTTAMVADRLQRDAIGIELSPDYVRLAEQRLRGDAGPMFSEIEVAG